VCGDEEGACDFHPAQEEESPRRGSVTSESEHAPVKIKRKPVPYALMRDERWSVPTVPAGVAL